MASIKLKWTVEELSNVMTKYNEMNPYKNSDPDLDPGSWVELTGPGTRVALVADQYLYEYIATALTTDAFAFSYFHNTTLEESSLSEPIEGEDTGGLYASIEDLRNEGFTETMISDERALAKLQQWSQYIETVTGKWFEPRQCEFRVDGDGVSSQRLPHPIIKIDSVAVVASLSPVTYDEDAVNLDELVIYNRHLTMGITNPDDRWNPRIEIHKYDDPWRVTGVAERTVWGGIFRFPSGRQNVRVTGLFGFTELGPGDARGETTQGSQIPRSYGSTPLLIKQLTLLLVARDYAQLANVAERDDWMKRWRVLEEKTREQSYKLQPLGGQGSGSTAGAWTGDPTIDGIIALFVRGGRSRVQAV